MAAAVCVMPVWTSRCPQPQERAEDGDRINVCERCFMHESTEAVVWVLSQVTIAGSSGEVNCWHRWEFPCAFFAFKT